jgi:small subunit ribosomal protein S2
LKELEQMSQDGRYEMFSKKEVGRLERERKHLEQNLSGIKEMSRLPDVVFVIDSNMEEIAVREARKLAIPVVAVVDTNCDPEQVTYPIPGNDDALRAIRLFTSKIADAVLEGRQIAPEQQTPLPEESTPASVPGEGEVGLPPASLEDASSSDLEAQVG